MTWQEATAIVLLIKLTILSYIFWGLPAVGYVLQGFLWTAFFYVAYRIAADYWGVLRYRMNRSRAFSEWTDRKDSTRLKGWF